MPVFVFEAADGQRIEATDPVFTNLKHHIGSTVSIVYPPASPKHARFASNLYTLQLLAGSIGLLMLLVGLLAGR